MSVTIYDIAKEAGVSASTVSRAINNKDGIHPETKKRILQLLKKYNYFPNETARGLVTKASRMIGILVSDIRTMHHTVSAYFIERELAKQGYCCIIFNTGPEDEVRTDYIQILKRRRVEGAILIGSTFQTEAIKEAISKYLNDVPVVIVNGYLDLPNVYGVLADEMNGVSDCVKLWYSKGHKNLAFVIDLHTPSNELKMLGFEQGLRNMGDKRAPLIWECESSLQGAYEATKKLMEEHPEVDGIIYAVDLLAAGGVRALTDMGIAIPEQVSVIGIDNSIYGEICNPRLTSLDNKLMDLSISSARILMDALQKQLTTKKILVFSSIVERETT
ncbi:MAG: LacI family transcriptional regulator [Firmicutes bacterium]|jgi:LacI family transcriptional regulator|nr:LacI family DNA-binding transcriptional regulator [Bacillota bacterium]NLL88579.1 LacI family transcriptional regulator [Bacillota bacterium]